MPMLACLWSLSAFWIFCLALDLKVRIERLTNGDGHESHTRRLGVRRPCACACPFLATPAGEWKFKSLRVTGRGKNTRLSGHGSVLYSRRTSHYRLVASSWRLFLRYSGPLSVFQEPCLVRSFFPFSPVSCLRFPHPSLIHLKPPLTNVDAQQRDVRNAHENQSSRQNRRL